MRSRGVRTVSLYIYVELALLRLFRGIVFVVSRKENALFSNFFAKRFAGKKKVCTFAVLSRIRKTVLQNNASVSQGIMSDEDEFIENIERETR